MTNSPQAELQKVQMLIQAHHAEIQTKIERERAEVWGYMNGADLPTWAEPVPKRSRRKAVTICDVTEGEPIDALSEGERIVARISFWLQLGFIGRWVASGLADQLDQISELIERRAGQQ